MARLTSKGGLFNDRQDIQFADVPCPEWGDAGEPLVVRVRGLTAKEVDRYQSSLVSLDKKGRPQPNAGNARARLAVLGIVDDQGRRIFTDDDAGQIGDKNSAALTRVCEKIHELSGMGGDALEEAKGNS